MIIMYFLKEIINYDLYSKRVILRIGSSGVSSTYYSKLITKIVFMIIIAYFVQSLIQIFERQNFKSKTTTRKAYPRPHISIMSNNFKFAFAVVDPDGVIIAQSELERYYVPTFYMLGIDEDYDITRNYSIIRNCTSMDFSDINDEQYISYNSLTNYSCIDDFAFEINGYNDETYKKLIFKLDYCDSAYYNNCKSFEEITDKLQGGLIYYYILENDIDVDNYDNPFISSFKMFTTDYLNINKTYFIGEERFLKRLEIKTDQSFFLQDFKSEFSFQLANEINYYSIPKIYASQIFYLNIYSYDKVDISTRNYDKIWNSISSLGGIMKIIIGLGVLLTRRFNENEESINLIKSKHLINISSTTNKDDHNGTKSPEKAIDNNKNNILNEKKILSKKGTNIEVSFHSSNMQEKSFYDNSLNPFNNDLCNPKIIIEKDLFNENIKNQEPQDCERVIEMEQNIKLPRNIDLLNNFKKKRKKYVEKSIINKDKKEKNPDNKELISNITDDNKINENNDREQTIESSKKKFISNKNDNKNNPNNPNSHKNEDLKLIKENLKKKFEKIKENQHHFSFTFIEKICMIIGFTQNKLKDKMFFIAKKELDMNLDIDYIIKKLEETEKLKHFIFNKNQLKIFDFLNRFPMEGNLNYKRYTETNQEKTELVDMINYLEKKNKRSSEINNINNKFIKIIGQIIQRDIIL